MEESPNYIVGDVGIVHEIEQVARHDSGRLGEIDQPVNGFRQLGCSAWAMPQLSRDKLRVRCARAHDAS